MTVFGNFRKKICTQFGNIFLRFVNTQVSVILSLLIKYQQHTQLCKKVLKSICLATLSSWIVFQTTNLISQSAVNLSFQLTKKLSPIINLSQFFSFCLAFWIVSRSCFLLCTNGKFPIWRLASIKLNGQVLSQAWAKNIQMRATFLQIISQGKILLW